MNTFNRFFLVGLVMFTTTYISFVLAVAIIADIRGLPMPPIY
jgi:hypothetical protein